MLLDANTRCVLPIGIKIVKEQLSKHGLGIIGTTRPTVKDEERPNEIADWLNAQRATGGELIEVN